MEFNPTSLDEGGRRWLRYRSSPPCSRPSVLASRSGQRGGKAPFGQLPEIPCRKLAPLPKEVGPNETSFDSGRGHRSWPLHTCSRNRHSATWRRGPVELQSVHSSHLGGNCEVSSRCGSAGTGCRGPGAWPRRQTQEGQRRVLSLVAEPPGEWCCSALWGRKHAPGQLARFLQTPLVGGCGPARDGPRQVTGLTRRKLTCGARTVIMSHSGGSYRFFRRGGRPCGETRRALTRWCA
jgi:hypothetical protein